MRTRDLGQNVPDLRLNALILDQLELYHTLSNYSYSVKLSIYLFF